MSIVDQTIELLRFTSALNDTFSELVTAFDAHDVPRVSRLLGEHVILNTLTPPNIIIGKKGVEDYLTTRFRQDGSIWFTPLSTNISAPTATVSGCALWIDQDRKAPGERIRYSFTFVLVDGNWLVTNLWGAEGGC
jgi:hypothetical protein